MDFAMSGEEALEMAGVELVTDLETDLPKVNVDGSMIREVFLNLIMNADQAMPPMGGNITVSSAQEGRCVIITVSDDGKGIPEELLESIRKAQGGHRSAGTLQADSRATLAGHRVQPTDHRQSFSQQSY